MKGHKKVEEALKKANDALKKTGLSELSDCISKAQNGLGRAVTTINNLKVINNGEAEVIPFSSMAITVN